MHIQASSQGYCGFYRRALKGGTPKDSDESPFKRFPQTFLPLRGSSGSPFNRTNWTILHHIEEYVEVYEETLGTFMTDFLQSRKAVKHCKRNS